MADYTAQSQKKMSVWDIKKLQLRGVPWEGVEGEQRPNLVFKITEAMNPRFSLYMNHPNEPSDGISIALDPLIMGQLIEMFRHIANSPDADKLVMKVKSAWERGKKLEKPVVTSTLSVGRNSDNVIYLSIHVKSKSPAVFLFLPNFWCELHDSQGEILNKAISSKLCALSYANTMSQIISTYLVIEAKRMPIPEPRPRPPIITKGSGINTWDNIDDDISF